MDNDKRVFLVPLEDPCLLPENQGQKCPLAGFGPDRKLPTAKPEELHGANCWFDMTEALVALGMLGECGDWNDYRNNTWYGRSARHEAEGLAAIVDSFVEQLGIEAPMPTKASECPGWTKVREELPLKLCYRDFCEALFAVEEAVGWFMATHELGSGTQSW